MGGRAWEDKEIEIVLVKEGDQLMAKAVGVVLSGQVEVHNMLPKVGKRSSSSQREHHTSPSYARLAQEMMVALWMARSIREGPRVGRLVARGLELEGMGIQLPCLTIKGEGFGRKDWLRYARVLEKRTKELRSKLHGDLRQRVKEQRTGGVRPTKMTRPASEGGGYM